MDLLQGTKVSGNAVIGVMAPQCGVESVDLFPDRQVPDSSQQVLQRHETAPQARFLGAHPNPEVALQVPRAVEREPQKVDRLWALPAMFGGMSLREPAKFDKLGLGRFQGQAELSQPLEAGILEDGEVYPNEEGTPQGGSISVLL